MNWEQLVIGNKIVGNFVWKNEYFAIYISYLFPHLALSEPLSGIFHKSRINPSSSILPRVIDVLCNRTNYNSSDCELISHN